MYARARLKSRAGFLGSIEIAELMSPILSAPEAKREARKCSASVAPVPAATPLAADALILDVVLEELLALDAEVLAAGVELAVAAGVASSSTGPGCLPDVNTVF